MTTSERLVDKAKEAFVMAIEIYNKPSINYRLEGFSFFICNAWELSKRLILGWIFIFPFSIYNDCQEMLTFHSISKEHNHYG